MLHLITKRINYGVRALHYCPKRLIIIINGNRNRDYFEERTFPILKYKYNIQSLSSFEPKLHLPFAVHLFVDLSVNCRCLNREVIEGYAQINEELCYCSVDNRLLYTECNERSIVFTSALIFKLSYPH